jgi:hypothetical protein
MIKYTVRYKSYDETQWRVDIDIPGYTGDPIFVNGKADEAGIMSFDGTTDEVWESPIVNTNMLTTMVSRGQIDVRELQRAKDRQFRYFLYREDVLKFSGYLIVDNMQRVFNAPPFDVQISATCGLNLLSGIPYVGFGGEIGTRIPLNYLRRVLMSTVLLGVDIPIRWSMRLRNNNPLITGDPMTSLIWGSTGESYADYGTQAKYCDYIIEGICKALQCRIFQADGAWWVLDIMEHMKDVIDYAECANSYGEPDITYHTRTLKKTIGIDYGFAKEDSLFLIKPALSGVQVKYEQDQNDNIIYNGSLDLWSIGVFPLHWAKDANVNFNSLNAITQRQGKAIELWLASGNIGAFKMEQSLPIESHLLYTTLSWGFSVLPLSGFNTDINGFIDWAQNPFKVSIRYTILENGSPVDYFLNEFGYWWNQNTARANQEIRQGYNSGNYFIGFNKDRNFFPGDVVNVQFIRNGSLETYEFIFDEVTPYIDGLNRVNDGIPDTTFVTTTLGQNIVINSTPTNPLNVSSIKKTPDSVENIRITVANLKLNDVANVEFNGRMEVKIPDPGIINASTNAAVGKLMMEFKVTGAQHFVLDEIWMSVNSNSDIYKATLNDSAKVEEYSLKISSSFSGFYYSNFMRTWGKSNEDYLFKDTDGYVGSLTAQYARSIMKFRNMPLDIFNGTINTRGYDWSFLDNYDIVETDGRFIPLTPTYNTERNEVNLIAIEARNDSDIDLNIVHLPSEKNQK